MAVVAGNSAQVLLDGFNLHQFAKSFEVTGQVDALDSSVLGTTSRTKIPGLRHGTASGEVFYDDTAIFGSAQVLKSLYGASSASIISFAPAGFALGNLVAMLYANESSFDPKSIVADLTLIMFRAEAAEDAIDFGVSLHALSAESSLPITGTSVDNAAATTNGGVGVLHVSAIAGGAPNVVYVIQHATDNATWVDLVTFTAVTAPGGQRIEVAAGTTVRRYLRIIATEGGTTSSVVGVAAFGRR